MTLPKLSNDLFPSVPSFIDRFFEGDLMDWNNRNFTEANSTMPAVNVKENDSEYQIDVAAPGLKKDDFKLSYENGWLTISSEKKNENEENSRGKIARREFHYQSFQRSFSMPESVVNIEKISAKYEDGILHIKLQKRDEVKPKPAKEIKIS